MNWNLKNKAEPCRNKERAPIVVIASNNYVVSRILLDSKVIGHRDCYLLAFTCPAVSELGFQVGCVTGNAC